MTDNRQHSEFENAHSSHHSAQPSRYRQTGHNQNGSANRMRVSRDSSFEHSQHRDHDHVGATYQAQSRYAQTRHRDSRTVSHNLSARNNRSGNSSYAQHSHPANSNHSSQMQNRPMNQYSRNMTPAYGGASAMARQQKSNNPVAVLVMIVVIIALAVTIGVRWFINSDTSVQLSETNSAITEQQTKLDELNQSNSDLQSKIDSMQSTIDEYNKLKN